MYYTMEVTEAPTETPTQESIEAPKVEVVKKPRSEAQVKVFLHDNGYPTDGVDAGAVDGAALIKLFFDPHARENFCEPVPDGMGFDPDVFETRFKPQMRELLKMHASIVSQF